MWTKKFWVDATERAIRTVAQSAAAILAASGVGLLDANWLATASAAGVAGVISLLFSISGEAYRPTGSASFLR